MGHDIPADFDTLAVRAGIRDSLLRVSVELESPADIVANLTRGLG